MEPTLLSHQAVDALTFLTLRIINWAQLGITVALVGALAGVIVASGERRPGR